MKTLGVGASEWVPIAWVFPEDWRFFMASVWPMLYVHASAIRNQPSSKDPLGAQASFTVAFDHDTKLATFTVFGESSPPLEPSVLQQYALVQWPDLFRVSRDGTQP